MKENYKADGCADCPFYCFCDSTGGECRAPDTPGTIEAAIEVDECSRHGGAPPWCPLPITIERTS